MSNDSIVIGVIVLVFLVFVLFPSKSIAQRIDENFDLSSKDNSNSVYVVPHTVNRTVNKINNLKRASDVRNNDDKYFMLYKDFIIVLSSLESRKSKVEVMSHNRAHRRHRSIIVSHWGSIRNGSVGRSLTRGGGFGFGK